jgi:hypothetical protein
MSAPSANGNGVKTFRHLLRRNVRRGIFSAFRQARFVKNIGKGLFLINTFVRGLHL